MAIIDRIKYDGRSKDLHWLVYKYPSEQFVLGSQLIVSQGQEALFIKGGEALDLFEPGTYTLNTSNLPILAKFVNGLFGGKTPFSAEIYYINKTVNLDIKWGTSTPIPLEDPQYKLILNISARGQYGISIMNSRLFVSRIIGAIPNGSSADPLVILRYFNGLINAKIKSVTAGYMIKKQISFLEISQYLSELSNAFRKTLSDEFERFGIEIINFYCESITPKPDEYKKLQSYKEELALGENFYLQRRYLDIFEKLAENSSLADMANASIDINAFPNMTENMEKIFKSMNQDKNSDKNKQIIICPKCMAENNNTMKFCGNCGKKLQ